MSSIAAAEGLNVAGRPQTERAAAANVVDAKALRAELAVGFLRDARRLQDEMFAPTVERKAMVVSQGRGEPSEVQIVEVHRSTPTFSDKQQIMTTRAIAVDKAMALERHDDTGDGDVADVDAWADSMLAAAGADDVAA